MSLSFFVPQYAVCAGENIPTIEGKEPSPPKVKEKWAGTWKGTLKTTTTTTFSVSSLNDASPTVKDEGFEMQVVEEGKNIRLIGFWSGTELACISNYHCCGDLRTL